MAENDDKSKRDIVLAKVLERLANQIRQNELKLEELAKNQLELMTALKSTEIQHDLRLNDADSSMENLNNNMQRYRSDMLKLVGEQDRLNDYSKDMVKRQGQISGAQEKLLQDMNALDDRYKTQEKTIREHYSHALKQSDTFSRELSDLSQIVTKLHMDTEKHLLDIHAQNQKHLEKVRLETMSRLLTLDTIESAMNTILIRTEPPEKKPFWPVRVIKRVRRFFSSRISRMIGKKRLKRKKQD